MPMIKDVQPTRYLPPRVVTRCIVLEVGQLGYQTVAPTRTPLYFSYFSPSKNPVKYSKTHNNI